MKQQEFIMLMKRYTADVKMGPIPETIAYLLREELPNKEILAVKHIITDDDRVVMYVQINDDLYLMPDQSHLEDFLESTYNEDLKKYTIEFAKNCFRGTDPVDPNFVEFPAGYRMR